MRGLKHKNLVPLLDYFQDKQAEILKSPLKVGLSSKFTRVLNFENFLPIDALETGSCIEA